MGADISPCITRLVAYRYKGGHISDNPTRHWPLLSRHHKDAASWKIPPKCDWNPRGSLKNRFSESTYYPNQVSSAARANAHEDQKPLCSKAKEREYLFICLPSMCYVFL